MQKDTVHEALIVGSGAAGVAAALAMAEKGVKPLMLDVGMDAPEIPQDFSGSFSSLISSDKDLFPHLIGHKYQALKNVSADFKGNLKLKAPYTEYVQAKSETLTPIRRSNFFGQISLAKGGLANAWGGGVYRFTDEDLSEFPVCYEDLEHAYDTLSAHMGISGQDDDLAPWFLQDKHMQKPLPMTRIARILYDRYTENKEFFNENGLHMGRARLAVLSEDKEDRKAYTSERMEFFRTDISAIYTPRHSIENMVKNGQLQYVSGWLVTTFEQLADEIKVVAIHIDTQEEKSFYCKKLFLAAGTINTSRIVLQSHNDTHTKLNILDNPLSSFPLFNLNLLGKKPESMDSSIAQLNFIYTKNDVPIQCSYYGVNGPLRSDSITELPFTFTNGRTFFNLLNSGFALCMCFYPGLRSENNFLQLEGNNGLFIHFEQKEIGRIERELIQLFKKVNYYSHGVLINRPVMGSGLHYAGTLPMRQKPGKEYECDPMCRLQGTSHVYIVDGASFSALPAKNLTLTIMANAMRVARAAFGK